MTAYKLMNLSHDTSSADRAKLEMQLKKLPGVRSVSVSVIKKEFSITCTGMEPNVHMLKEACASAGFTIGRKA